MIYIPPPKKKTNKDQNGEHLKKRKHELQNKNSLHRKFNIDPANGWLEDYLPFGRVTFQGLR